MIMQAEEWRERGIKEITKLDVHHQDIQAKLKQVTACWTICKVAGVWLCVDVWVFPDIFKDDCAFSFVGTTCQTAECHLAQYLNSQQHNFVACWCIRVCFSCNALTRNWTWTPHIPNLGQRVNRHAAPSSAGHGLTSDKQMCYSCSSLLSHKSWPNELTKGLHKY